MVPRKRRRIPKLPPMRNTNEVVREESSFMDAFIILTLALVVLPWAAYFLG